MQLPRQQAIRSVGRNERGQGQSTAVGKQQGDLGYAADVLVPIRFAEAKIFVQAEADVVAVEAVGGIGGVEQVLLEGGRDGGFARGGEAGEPDCEARLAAEGGAFGVGEGVGVPSYIAGDSSGGKEREWGGNDYIRCHCQGRRSILLTKRSGQGCSNTRTRTGNPSSTEWEGCGM